MFPTRRVTAFLLGASLASLPLTASGAQIELERRVSEVYRTASPAVVNITAQIQSYDWFRGQVTQEGSGSGFVYDSGGRIVTNYHVVEAADQLQVTFKGGEVRDARLVGADPANDLAVLEVAAGAGDPRPADGWETRTLWRWDASWWPSDTPSASTRPSPPGW